jgi:hypothetical protein
LLKGVECRSSASRSRGEEGRRAERRRAEGRRKVSALFGALSDHLSDILMVWDLKS